MCGRGVLIALAVAAAAVVAPLGVRYARLEPGQPLALMGAHNATVQPSLHHSRLRAGEVRRSAEQEFYQWWNFLVFDAETRDHVNLYYGLHYPSNESGDEPYAKVGLVHLRGAERVAAGKEILPMSRVRTANEFDLEFLGEDGAVRHSMTALDDGTYRLVGSLEGAVEWDVTVRRISGNYGSLDTEDPGTCLMTSTLFGYHSAAEGTVRPAGGVAPQLNVTLSPRYRAYAAGSWGCQLPTGDPPIEHPWTWFWLVLPGEDPAGADDVGIVGGTARFATPIGPIEGGYAYAGGVPAAGGGARHHYSTRYARLFHRSAAELLLQASSSDGHFMAYTVEQDEWATFRDEAGEARVPLRQTFRFSSAEHDFVVDFRPTLEQYFRAPVVFGKDLFSDFRAVGAATRVTVLARPSGEVLVDTEVDTMNAVEFAYVTPSTPEMREEHK